MLYFKRTISYNPQEIPRVSLHYLHFFHLYSKTWFSAFLSDYPLSAIINLSFAKPVRPFCTPSKLSQSSLNFLAFSDAESYTVAQSLQHFSTSQKTRSKSKELFFSHDVLTNSAVAQWSRLLLTLLFRTLLSIVLLLAISSTFKPYSDALGSKQVCPFFVFWSGTVFPAICSIVELTLAIFTVFVAYWIWTP